MQEAKVFEQGTVIEFDFVHVPEWGRGVPECSLGKGYFCIEKESPKYKGWYDIKGCIHYHFDDDWYGEIPFTGSFQLIGITADIFMDTFNGGHWHFIEHHNFDQKDYRFKICTHDTTLSAIKGS